MQLTFKILKFKMIVNDSITVITSDCMQWAIQVSVQLPGGGEVVVRMPDFGSKGPGFDSPGVECMFVNIYHY